MPGKAWKRRGQRNSAPRTPALRAALGVATWRPRAPSGRVRPSHGHYRQAARFTDRCFVRDRPRLSARRHHRGQARSLRSYDVDGVAIVEGSPPDVPAGGGRGQLLLPWPNRVRDGRYAFDGHSYQLALTDPALHNASHGLVRWEPWAFDAFESHRVSLTYALYPHPGYPFALRGQIDALTGDGLAVRRSAPPMSARRDAPTAPAPTRISQRGRCQAAWARSTRCIFGCRQRRTSVPTHSRSPSRSCPCKARPSTFVPDARSVTPSSTRHLPTSSGMQTE